MTDRTGMTYNELLAIQERQIDQWSGRIEPHLFAEIICYVRAMNQEATDPAQKHRVYRGQDLIELLRTWPDRNTYVYPNPPSEAESMI